MTEVPPKMLAPAARQGLIRAARWRLPQELWLRQRQVVIVCAPAGYGKSTLLARWQDEAREMGAAVVHAAASPDDDDGEQLMLDLLGALAPVDEERSRMLIGGMGSGGRRALGMALIAEMRAQRQRTLLFIDDLHWLGDDAVGAFLQLLTGHQPESLGIVVSGRSDFAASVSEPMLQGRLLRFGPRQLAFEDAEVTELLSQHGLRPRPALVSQITSRSGGWPAVVRLIAMTLQECAEQTDSALEGLLERRDMLTSYLFEVLLSRLPARTSRFLMGIAVLRRFSVELARAATGMDEAAGLLEELERRALPLARSDDAALPWELHALVREFLLSHARNQNAEELHATAQRAIAWLLDANRIDAAIELSLDMGDVDAAAVLIDRFARLVMRQYGQHLTFLRWCNRLSPAQLRRFPRVQSLRVWALNIMRRYDEADAALAELDAVLAHPPWPEAAPSELDALRRLVDLEHCVKLVVRDHWIPLEPLARTWIARWQSDAEPLHLGMAQVMVGCGMTATSEFGGALEHMRVGRRLIGESQAHYCLAWTQMWLTSVLIKQGHYRQAQAECDDAIARVTNHLGGRTPAQLMLQAMRALLLYEKNQLDEAGEALEDGMTALVEQSSVDSLIAGHVTLARILVSRGRHLEAISILAEGEAMGWRQNLPRLAVGLTAERVDLLLRDGQPGPARALWDELCARVDDSGASGADRLVAQRALADKAGRIQARQALAEGRSDVARPILDNCLRQARASGQKRKRVELLLLQARVHLHLQERNAAFALLQEALDIGMLEGYVRVFADEGSEVSDMLKARLLAKPAVALREYLLVLLGAFDDAETQGAESAPPSPGTFTRRELKILSKLPSGLTNRELAHALFITEGTLKWHLKNIYSKLGVTNRASAIRLSRESGYAL